MNETITWIGTFTAGDDTLSLHALIWTGEEKSYCNFTCFRFPAAQYIVGKKWNMQQRVSSEYYRENKAFENPYQTSSNDVNEISSKTPWLCLRTMKNTHQRLAKVKTSEEGQLIGTESTHLKSRIKNQTVEHKCEILIASRISRHKNKFIFMLIIVFGMLNIPYY